MNPPPLVTTQSALEDLCKQVRERGALSFDTEFIRDDTYDAKLCLVQIHDGDGVALIDPTAGLDMAPFWDLVTDPQVLCVVHAGKEDFEVCLRQCGSPPRNIFDVQVAAGFVGLGYPLSLVRLVAATVSRRLTKGQTLTDWLRRPLTDEQLRYAVDDVRYLPAIHRKLSRRLNELDREHWAREEFARFEQPTFYKAPAEERSARLKGARKLDGHGEAVLARLIDWRDRWAQERNRPARALMRDDVLVEIARRRPTKTSELEVMRGFHQAKNARLVAELVELIAATPAPPAGRAAPVDPREESPMTRSVLDLLSAVMRAACHEGEISSDLVGGASRLRELLEHLERPRKSSPAPTLLTGWRAEFIGQRLVDLLEGRAEVHLSGWPKSPRLAVELARG